MFESIKKADVKLTGPEWNRLPLTARMIIGEMLRKDPLQRPDVASCVNHIFFLEAERIHIPDDPYWGE